MKKLDPKENELRGRLIFSEGKIIYDDVNRRIEKLINNYLVFIKTDKSGWIKLFIDPDDNRYWELTYPESEIQGGGALYLRNISKDEAIKKYQLTS